MIGTATRRVVGVVYNAVDDHLSGSDQLHLRWSLDDLRLLRPLLYEASTAGRTLIITADHGHVIDEQTLQRTAADGDRWRNAVHGEGGPVQADETLLEGGRVCAPNGGSRIVCAWSERLRYGGKKNGYHGGVAPRRWSSPSASSSPGRSRGLGGGGPASQPVWWERGPGGGRRPLPAGLSARRREQDETHPRPVDGGWAPHPGRLDRGLLSRARLKAQLQMAGRVAARGGRMRQALDALDERGGKLRQAALAQRLGLAPCGWAVS